MTNETAKVFNLDIQAQGVAIVTIDAPGESVNTLKADFAEEVTEILTTIQNNSEIKGVVFMSGKPNSFIVGADIHMIDECQTAEEASELAKHGQAIFNQIEQLKIPVIAAIHGPALGGGLELALACHGRVLSDSPQTTLGLPEVQLGLLPGSGGTQRLPRLVGLQQGLTLMLTGRSLRPQQAKKMGLAHEVVPESILLETAIELALKGKPAQPKPRQNLFQKALKAGLEGPLKNTLFEKARAQAQQKAQNNYPAIDCIIDAVKVGATEGFQAGLDYEAKKFGELAMTKVSKELRNLFFVTTEMKKEVGTDLAQPKPVKQVGILGGGLMGGGIAHVTIQKAKLPVRLKDIRYEGIQHAMQYHYQLLQRAYKRKHLNRAEFEKRQLMLSGGLDYQGFQHSDIVIEAVFEDLALKQKMVAEVETHTSEQTIFASNTSSLPITDIAKHAKRPEQVIGLHYFSPVEKMPLAEIIVHEKTSAQTIATTMAFAKKQGKTPILVKDGAGFYVNRILAPYMNEAAYLLRGGEPIDKIDKAFVQFGFPIGPITLLDEVGIDVASKVAPILESAFGVRFEVPPLFETLLADGRKGKKSKKGFYQYARQQKNKQVDESIYTLLGIEKSPKLHPEVIVKRCLLMMLNEAAWCLADKVIQSPRDGDIGAIFGIGFPPFLGGPFRFMDTYGIDKLVEALEVLAQEQGERYQPCPLLKEMASQQQTFYDKI